ncbi:histidine phosphatase family protein [Azorhizobium sp. AG788]|uniref:histidine phosphatase family protein n=1 Tax=Azorhizobium sp. AG788 TaxID=2183897 RepID=UPI0031392DED
MARMRLFWSTVIAAAALIAQTLAMVQPAGATPARLIILRHGEKADPYRLCEMGRQRARALVKQYLGKDAQNSLFAPGTAPEAVYTISIHTIETASPTANSWDLPLVFYSVIPAGKEPKLFERDLARRSKQAADTLLTDPRFDGKTVIVVWEHNNIADASLPPAEQALTLRYALNLNRLPGVPETWPDQTYDYFWIVDYAPGSPIPVSFKMQKQVFTGPFASLPQNDWGQPDGLDPESTDCTK